MIQIVVLVGLMVEQLSPAITLQIKVSYRVPVLVLGAL